MRSWPAPPAGNAAVPGGVPSVVPAVVPTVATAAGSAAPQAAGSAEGAATACRKGCCRTSRRVPHWSERVRGRLPKQQGSPTVDIAAVRTGPCGCKEEVLSSCAWQGTGSRGTVSGWYQTHNPGGCCCGASGVACDGTSNTGESTFSGSDQPLQVGEHKRENDTHHASCTCHVEVTS